MDYFCNDCPRKCNAFRSDTKGDGVCKTGYLPHVVRAAPHFGEEPCISGTLGSGAVFFSGCSMRCIFCQNHAISRDPIGKTLNQADFLRMLSRLQDTGVHNINLVTGSHHIRFIAETLQKADLRIPVIWNSSGYESAEMLRMLDGLISVYLPDYKYRDAACAKRYSLAGDYPEVAEKAIREMYRQTGPYRLDSNGLLTSGVLIRHLILPGELNNSKAVIDWVAEEYQNNEILFSLMSQYTPVKELSLSHQNLRRTVRKGEYETLYNYMKDSGILNGYCQELDSSTTDMIPEFDGTGV